MELTETIRAQARQDAAEEAARSKMSEKTAANLRSINYEEKLRLLPPTQKPRFSLLVPY